jgi:hypothetical protein
VLLLAGCWDRNASSSTRRLSREEPTDKEDAARGPGGGSSEGWYGGEPTTDMPAPAAASALMESDGVVGGQKGGLALSMSAAKAPADERERGRADQSEPAPARSWFPESFLWMPMVETDATGHASVRFPVPDSLTTWRVLALAQSAEGAQSGGLATFASTLPAYVDVVVPGSLMAGDEVFLPVQVVNTTPEVMRQALSVSVSGGQGGASGTLDVAAGGSGTRPVRVVVSGPGQLTVRASYGAIDTAERSIPVRPAGKLRERTVAGAMGTDREVTLAAMPDGQFGEVVLTAWPGALSVVRSELLGGGDWFAERSMAPGPGGALDEAAYRYALAIAGQGLIEAHSEVAGGASGSATGDVTPELLRSARLASWQPLARAGRVPDAGTACLLAEALRGASTESLDGKLGARMVESVIDAQAPDGTWITGASNIDDTLVQTALCTRAAGDVPSVRLRAEGAFARNLSRLENPVLAAFALASGAITDVDLAGRLADTVRGALTTGEDGTRRLEAGGVRGPSGRLLSDAAATAAAALALHATSPADSADLATALMGMRSPWGGWGGGADLLALRAIQTALPTVDPSRGNLGSGTVSLAIDGATAASGGLDASERFKPITLRASAPATGQHSAKLTSTVPGLVFTLTQRAWVPWAAPSADGALLVLAAPAKARVGEVSPVAVRVATPSTVATDVTIGLPAGVRADAAGMDSLVAAGAFAAWTGSEGSVLLRGVPGGGWDGALPVTPSLAGSLQATPSLVREADGGASLYELPPVRWQIGG